MEQNYTIPNPIKIKTGVNEYDCQFLGRLENHPVHVKIFFSDSTTLAGSLIWSGLEFGLEELNNIQVTQNEMIRIRDVLEQTITDLINNQEIKKQQFSREEITQFVIESLIAPDDKDNVSLQEVLKTILENQLYIMSQFNQQEIN